MFDVIRKSEYFRCLDDQFASPQNHSLKGIQDGWILGELHGVRDKRILEVGGGNSRVLPRLSGNRLWNADKFEGVGNGPTAPELNDAITVIPTFMGEFSQDIPVVDIIFSISVVEHFPFEEYAAAFKDMARCLAPGGVMYHTIDVPLANEPLEVARKRIKLLIAAIEEAGLKWHEPPSIGCDAIFEADMASNSDLTLWGWSKISEPSRLSGPKTQLVSLKMIARK